MRQDHLTEIWEQLKKDEAVEGWGGASYDELDTLTRHDPKTIWQRKKPDGPWEELRGLSA